jgi:predicted O-methyltransferase YrrM
MLERRDNPAYKSVSRPSQDAINLVRLVLTHTAEPSICEIGVGIGATTLELCRALNNHGELWLFDYEKTVSELANDLRQQGFCNVRTFGNQPRTYDSYAWQLAKVLRKMYVHGWHGLFDVAYLDGAHAFHHDAPATVLLKQLLRRGGVLLFDDYEWSFATSLTMNPNVRPSIQRHYSDEQIATSHVKMICELFLDRDPGFRKIDLGYKGREYRRAYQKLVDS